MQRLLTTSPKDRSVRESATVSFTGIGQESIVSHHESPTSCMTRPSLFNSAPPQPEPDASEANESETCLSSRQVMWPSHVSRNRQYSSSFRRGPVILTHFLHFKALHTARFISLVNSFAAGTTKLKEIHLPIILWRHTNDTDCSDSICSRSSANFWILSDDREKAVSVESQQSPR